MKPSNAALFPDEASGLAGPRWREKTAEWRVLTVAIRPSGPSANAKAEAHKRREAFRRAKLKEGDDPPCYFVTNPLSLAADRQKLIDDIKRQVGTDIQAVVCIDTLNRSLAGLENSDEDMAAYIKAAVHMLTRQAFCYLYRYPCI